MDVLEIAAIGVAVVAAFRGTWSPCGVSMLSSITPLSERARGNRYGVTVIWFILGSILGGLTLGALAALGAILVAVLDLSMIAVTAAVVLAAVVTLASDLGFGGFRLPANPRQVERTWLDRYRSWVYGVGFGWQLGVGVATFVMSATVYLMVVLAAMTGRPLFALGVVTLFGSIRGLAILPAARVRTSADLGRLHRGIERFRSGSRVVAVLAQITVIGLAVGLVSTTVAGVAVGGLLAFLAWAVREGLSDPAPRVRKRTGAPPDRVQLATQRD